MAIDETEITARGLIYHDADKCIHLKCIIFTKLWFYKVTWTCIYTKGIVAKEIEIEIIIFMFGCTRANYITEFLSLM